MADDDKAMFRAAKRACNKARKADGKTIVTCPASRHAQMIAENVGARKPYPMLQEEPEHCAASILSAVESLYEARLLLSRNLSLTAREVKALHAAADFLSKEGFSMPTMDAHLTAATLRSIAASATPQASPQAPDARGERK